VTTVTRVLLGLGADSAEDASNSDERSVVGRVFAVLSAFRSDQMSMSLTELAEQTGLAKGTLHRLCKQLVGQGAIERTKYGYRLGFRLAELGSRVVTTSRLREVAMPFLQELNATTRGAAHLGIVVDDDVYFLEAVCSHNSASVSARPGLRTPVHNTALGLAILAAGSDDAWRAYARRHNLNQQTLATDIAATRISGAAAYRLRGQPFAIGSSIKGPGKQVVCGISVVYPPLGARPRETAIALAAAVRGLEERLILSGAKQPFSYPRMSLIDGPVESSVLAIFDVLLPSRGETAAKVMSNPFWVAIREFGPALAPPRALDPIFSDRSDVLLGYLGSLRLSRVRGDLAAYQQFRRQGYHRLVYASQPWAPLSDYRRPEAGITIPWHRDVRRLGTGEHRLGLAIVAGILAVTPCWIVLAIAHIQVAFEGPSITISINFSKRPRASFNPPARARWLKSDSTLSTAAGWRIPSHCGIGTSVCGFSMVAGSYSIEIAIPFVSCDHHQDTQQSSPPLPTRSPR
jgi:DNA-binding IclR family transcriptional regulator